MNLKKFINLFKIKSTFKFRTIGLSIIFLLFGSCLIPVSLPIKVNQNNQQSAMIIDGQVLFAPMSSNTTYLIDNTGTVTHTWSSNFFPGAAVYWLGNGTILRTIKDSENLPGYGGVGGGVQKVNFDGTVEWDFRYNTEGCLSHHDVKSLPNGNVLLIAWETKTRLEAIDSGRNPYYISINGLMPVHIIEVKPTGPTSGDIVWEWHVWDHLIQDYDSSKRNFGVVKNHPELVDINYAASSKLDWLHTNSIDYNEEFDQIMLCVCYFNEIWVIDHSTTTEEAAGHTGGNSGKGGDIIYRWGNPIAYHAGNSNDQKFFGQHDAQWIDAGCPGQGNILIFNNGASRPNVEFSTIDEIIPPVNENGEYYLESGSAYGPEKQKWNYTANPPSSFFSKHLSGIQRLTNGNTLICNGEQGIIFEVTPEGKLEWQYTNPYPHYTLNSLFKVLYIPTEEPQEPNIPDLDCYGNLYWTNVQPGATVNGSFQVQNIGEHDSLLNWKINTSSVNWGTWSFNPHSGVNLTPEDGPLTVQVSVRAPFEKNTAYEGHIRVENQNDMKDFDVIPIYLNIPRKLTINALFLDFFKYHLNLFNKLQLLLKK